ncbi:MAG: hypothetical protein PHF84_00140 [bacterium]|nr:hypothetical protein [bacterium]
MKKINITFILFFSMALWLSGMNRTPENIYSGYGYVAGVDNINSVVINPANLYVVNNDEIYITFSRPFLFHSVAFGFPLGTDFYLGMAFVAATNNFHQYRAGFNMLNSEYIKLGLTTGLDREIQSRGSDRVGVALSPGLTVLLISSEDIDFNLTLGVNYKNLMRYNNFKSTTNFTKNNIDMGLRSELFIKDLFVNLGANYFSGDLKYSTSVEYLVLNELNIGLGIRENDVVFGFTINFLNNFMAFGYEKKNYSLSYCVSLNNMLVMRTEKAARKKVRHVKPVSRSVLNKQKQLLDEGLKLYKEKQYEEAKQTWQKLIRMAPSTDYAKEARNYIQKVNNILRSFNE